MRYIEKLTKLCTIRYGYAFESKMFSNNPVNIALVRIRDVKTGKSDTYYSGDYDPVYLVNRGDILIGMDGEFNIAKWKSEPALLNQRVCKIIPNINTDGDYLLFNLSLKLKEIERETSFVTVKHLSAKTLNEISLKMHNLEEQRVISRQLGTLQEIIIKKNKQLIEYDQLIKSRFVEMFGDPESNTKKYPMVNLSDIAQYFNGLTYSPENVSDEGIIVLRSSNIQNSKLDFKDLVRVRLNVKENKMVRENDILMCSRNGSAKLVGKVAIIDNLPERMAFGAFMMIIRSEYHAYLMSYFQMDAFRRQITTGATTTINQITSRMLDNVRLPLPEKSQVREFEFLVKQVDKLKFEDDS